MAETVGTNSQALLADLCAMTLAEVAHQPALLNKQKEDIDREWRQITTENYKAFLDAHVHLGELATHFKAMPDTIHTLVGRIPDIQAAMVDCEAKHQASMETSANVQLIARELLNLEPILEIPTLFETLIRNGHYEEAMDLQLFVQKLLVKHPDIPFLTQLSLDQTSAQAMVLRCPYARSPNCCPC